MSARRSSADVNRIVELETQLEQAIDALREIATNELYPESAFVREFARAALVKLGEKQP